MIDQISARHEEEYGSGPSVICSAPGKIDLLGEHSRYGEGYILSFPVNLRLFVAVGKRQDNALRFFSADLNERKKSSISGLKFKREDRWSNYAKGVMDGLIQMGFNVEGMNITLLSSIPMSIGISSSTALTVATACAIKELFELDISERQIIEVSRLAVSNFMGLQEGIYSPIITYHAKMNHLAIIDLMSLKLEHIPFPPGQANFLVTDSKVSDNIGNEEHKRIKKACIECLRVLRKDKPVCNLRDLREEDLSLSVEGLGERSRRICLHLIQENSRIFDLKAALNEGNMTAAGKILFHSHEGLRDFLEITCPEIDWLTKRAMETEGVYGSRMIASHYGGCTITLLDDDKRSGYEEHFEEYDRIFGFKTNTFSIGTGSGAQVHRTLSGD